MIKVAVLGKIHNDGLKILKKNNFKIIQISNFSKKNLINQLSEVDAIAIRTTKLDKEILEKCKLLKIVARHGVGFDNVDLDYLNRKKIPLAITGTANAITVAEHVMAMFLNLSKLLKISDQIVRAGKFEQKNSMQETFELYNKNILIIGYGRIGRALAKRCSGFESNIYVSDPYVSANTIKRDGCKKIELEKGIKLADFITIHLPLNSKTKYLISKKQFLKMKKNCVLINTSRGGIVNETDLSWALKNQIIHSAGLDVYEKEPPNIRRPLFSLNNIILSPHNASLTIECKKRLAAETCNNIVYYLKKRSKLNLNNIVNKKILKNS